ncbi:PD-(D/E)XK nuclease family protein [Kangiella sp. TOML190]|uniref:PD-(D/E)XK nuclease family protein n=1 Tax=Kangiella sp. TOML190 TaxID=2931351 RepID=UPI002040A666|nr:PD-(D/E)XK nuclease family protein [Kangiella sp. TOML190]
MKSSYPLNQIDPKNSVIITGSQRLSRHLREEFNKQQNRDGKSVWHSLQVMPWGAWTNLLWQWLAEQRSPTSEPLPYVLSEQQAQHLWQEIVEQSSWNSFLLQIPATSKKAWQAWQQYEQWQLSINPAAAWDKDLRAFIEWSNSFSQKLADNHWLDAAASVNLLSQQFDSIAEFLPDKIYLAGFEQITPQQQELFDLMSQSSAVEWLKSSSPPTKPSIIKFNNAREEFRHVILDAKAAVLEHSTSNPDYKYAIVVPELEQHKPLLERLLWQELTPCFKPEDSPIEGIYDFSLGEPLAKHSLVATATNLLKLVNGSVERDTMRRLLMSPYWGNDSKITRDKAKIEVAIRASSKPRFSLKDIAQYDPEGNLSELIDDVSNAIKLTKQSKSIAEWMSLIPKILATAQWPGHRELSSREYQIQQSLLESFNGLKSHQLFYRDAISFSKLLELLLVVIAEKQFHQEQPKAPIQIMGLLETVGLEFDKVWLTGATYQVLPSKANPNPFIEKSLLKQHQMPGCSAQRELDYAQQLFTSVLSASPQVTVSYPLFEGESELLPSPLLSQYRHQAATADTSLIPTPLRQLSNLQLDEYQDEQGIELTDKQIKGGTGFFKDQINCPFKAYLSYRLRAKAFEEAEEGLNALERGQIVHKVLERFWKAQASSEILQDKTQQQLLEVILPYLEQVLIEFKQSLYFLQIDSFFANEKHRLLQQLTQALMVDARRLPFTPLHHEQTQSIEVAELIFNLQVDRIDQVEDGLLIIDYKTGNPQRKALLSEPPEEPQLALYAINQKEQNVAGVSFFNINAKETRYQGIADTIENLALGKRSAIKTPMSSFIENWKLQLEAVAKGIKQGIAIVNPRTCDYCDFSSACRINQRRQILDDELDSAGGAG